MNEYQASIYPETIPNPTVTNAEKNGKNLAVCFSGGGSRALTCAWGQLLGLSLLTDPTATPLLNQARYISSVSGGSWAAVLYTFLPETVSYADFLGNCYAPSQLYYDETVPGSLNVTSMDKKSLGKIPQNFANLFERDPLKNIIVDFITITALKGIPLSTSAKWLWMYIVGKNVLADFDLYDYEFSLFQSHEISPWDYPDAKLFSLNKTYADANIFSAANPPPKDAFVYARTRATDQPAGPMLIINTNIVGAPPPGVFPPPIIQIPTQVSAVSAGVYGKNPTAADGIGGGSVETFAFTSTFVSQTSSQQVSAAFPRKYTLADITASSSAFYAAALADPLVAVINNLLDHSPEELHSHLLSFVDHIAPSVLEHVRGHLLSLKNELDNLSKNDLLKSLVPKYNYWPLTQLDQGNADNRLLEFTDGGDLENTGVAGLLAQVQDSISHILAFVNGAEVLEKSAENIVIAATQIAPLFGVAYNDVHKQFKDYLPNGLNPFTGIIDATGFLKVFDNSHAEFEALCNGLYAANGNGASSNAAFFQQSLTVVENTLLGIAGGHQVTVIWVQNARVNQWQDQIPAGTLKDKIHNGQAQGGWTEFANFPYYSTFEKIHQTAAETNTLAQMWAWCVSNQNSPLSTAIVDLFAQA